MARKQGIAVQQERHRDSRYSKEAEQVRWNERVKERAEPVRKRTPHA